MSIHGPNSISLVPSYLLLGEASIGLNQTTQAESYLSLAKWAVMKMGEGVENGVRALLNRNFGLLYKAKGMWEESLEFLALDVGICYVIRHWKCVFFLCGAVWFY